MSWQTRECIGHPLAMGGGGCGFVGVLEVGEREPPCPMCGGWTEEAGPAPVVAKDRERRATDQAAMELLEQAAEAHGYTVGVALVDGELRVRVTEPEGGTLELEDRPGTLAEECAKLTVYIERRER